MAASSTAAAGAQKDLELVSLQMKMIAKILLGWNRGIYRRR